MLVNISNHPCTEWQPQQIEAAKPYINIQDIPFPKIDPSWKSKHIQAIAKQITKQVLNLKEQSRDLLFAVHIMGEYTFVYTIVNLLQRQNITCLVSTSPRKASILNDRKLAHFSFTRFREYPKLFCLS